MTIYLWRLEQAAALTGRAREFLKEQRVLEPAEFRIARIVGEQRSRAREHIFRRVAASIPKGLAGTLEDLLVVKPDENSSGLQSIKANPSKPSVDAMLTLLDKLRARLAANGIHGQLIFYRWAQVGTRAAASEIDVSQLLLASAGTRLQYQLILDRWRQIGAILDTPGLARASKERQDALVRRIAALRAQLPADCSDEPISHPGAKAHAELMRG